MNQNQTNFCQFKFDKQEIGGKLKNLIVLKIWGKKRRKVEKVSQKTVIFSGFLAKFGRKHPQT